MADHGEAEFTKRLGAEIRTRRLARGLSLRALAKELNLSGHGNLVDYELGRRIPPENLVDACERVFDISDGALRNLREKALAERANAQVERMLRTPEETTPEPDTEPVASRPRRRWIAVAVAAAIVVAAGAGVGVRQMRSSGSSASAVRFGFEDGDQRWSQLWGVKVLDYSVTQVVAYEGKQSLALVATGATNENKAKAIGVTHGLETLKPGMKVSLYLRVPTRQRASVRFFAYDSQSREHWARETPVGGEAALPDGNEWKRYEWTVPDVDVVHAIGMEIYQWTESPVTVWLDAVTW
ncbi:helix-turn-helix domain-containing protein [Amycolatopsis pigmentata]|uniref:Multiprotein-bridging factor 1 family protein n=1 Tax=Amycolatopsis pigmentata TaxID=450801 RepID=A0ABW5G345_9PSEU